MTAVVQAIEISKSYETRGTPLEVLRGCTLSLDAGRSVAILGPSGSGKSTLLNILGTLERPTGGQLRLCDDDPWNRGEEALADFRNRRIGFVFQDHHLLPQCSALENVLIPTLTAPSADAVNRANDLLTRVGLADRRDHRPSELSGGERQRVALARALVNRPALLLADEPTGNLDRAAADIVADMLLDLVREERTALVIVTHSESLAARFDQRRRLQDGRLVGA